MENRIIIDYIPETGEVVLSLPNGWQRTFLSLDDTQFAQTCLHYTFSDNPSHLTDDARKRLLGILQPLVDAMHNNSANSLLCDSISVLVSFIKPVSHE